MSKFKVSPSLMSAGRPARPALNPEDFVSLKASVKAWPVLSRAPRATQGCFPSVGPDTGKDWILIDTVTRYGVGCRFDPTSGLRSQESGHVDGTRRCVRCRLGLLNRMVSGLKENRLRGTGGQGRTELPSRDILRYSRHILSMCGTSMAWKSGPTVEG